MRYFEDIDVGEECVCGEHHITEKELIDFASQWDPADMHLDREKAAQSPYGGLIASGAHVLSIYYKLCHEMLALQGPIDAIATLGFEASYPNPVRPGDTLALHFKPTEKRASNSNPDVGIAKNLSRLINQNGDVALELKLTAMYNKRPAKT